MKKSIIALSTLALFACQNENIVENTEDTFVVTGHCYKETRTAFGTPDATEIPFKWTAGDYIWLGTNKSAAIPGDCTLAQFTFKGGSAVVGTGHIFYNMTGEAKTAYVLPNQSADGNLGNDGDFGYATLDEYGSFCLEHKTAYVWFDTKTTDPSMPKLSSISLSTDGIAIAGKKTYDFLAGDWATETHNSSSSITLKFEGGHQLQASNEGVMAAMVVLPAHVAGSTLTVTYIFEDGSVYVEEKPPKKDFVSGSTQRISTTIKREDLCDYKLRVLTFEDEDKKFEPYPLDYADDWSGREITKWSDLIDDPIYSGPLLYGNGYASTGMSDAAYYWWDDKNTYLYHMFPNNGWPEMGFDNYCYAGGGHAVSNYWAPGYTDEDRDKHILKYYGQDYIDKWAGNDQGLGWFCVQLMTPVRPHSGANFIVHYGYKDEKSFIENLPELSFCEGIDDEGLPIAGEPRVIDHIYVTNTNYTLNQLVNGVKSEENNTFGGNWTGLKEDAWLKIVAYGFDSFEADPNMDEPTSTTEFYLVKGFDVVEDWQRWDLSVLGKVAKVRFNFLYSPDMGGKYGFTIPGYFAYDDIAVRFE